MATTVAHDMLHCVNVYHHGEKDQNPVWWYYGPNVRPGNQMYESVDDPSEYPEPTVALRTHITIMHEDGTVVPPASARAKSLPPLTSVEMHLNSAEVVAALEIVGIDDSKTATDGPRILEAKVWRSPGEM